MMQITVGTLMALSKGKATSFHIYLFQGDPAGCFSTMTGANSSAINENTFPVLLPLLPMFDHVKLSLLVAGCRADCCASHCGILHRPMQHQHRQLWLSFPDF